MAKRLIGLTGKTGAGKSTVSKILKEHGAFIIDGDAVSREVLKTSPELEERLKKAFGDDIYEGKTLNRALLAKRAFSSKESTELLNSIFHPVINGYISALAKKAFLKYDTVVVDAAALIESGFFVRCDMLVTVTAPKEIRLERIMKRDKIDRDAALLRMNAQKSDEFYTENADIIIKNYEPHDISVQMKECMKVIFG